MGSFRHCSTCAPSASHYTRCVRVNLWLAVLSTQAPGRQTLPALPLDASPAAAYTQTTCRGSYNVVDHYQGVHLTLSYKRSPFNPILQKETLAQQQSSALTIQFRTMRGQAAEYDCGGTSWPVLDGIVIMGVTGAVDVDAVTRCVLPGGTEMVSLDGRPLRADQARLTFRVQAPARVAQWAASDLGHDSVDTGTRTALLMTLQRRRPWCRARGAEST